MPSLLLKPDLPIPISRISNRYFLFDIAAVSYLRREHNIGGVLIGSLPQVPQQNVFLGLPLELMPEEARLLVDHDIGYIMDDTSAHSRVAEATVDQKARYLDSLRQQGSHASTVQASKKEMQRQAGIEKQRKKGKKVPGSPTPSQAVDGVTADDSESLFAAEPTSTSTTSTPRVPTASPLPLTPATSSILLPSSPSGSPVTPSTPPSYQLYAHLHSKGYFLSPGLRFGCQYMAYPGDPLRFHSHFLCVHTGWDEELDLMDIVGGGRLGTGVKKGFLIGGQDPRRIEDDARAGEDVRTFSIEWAGM